MRHLRDILDNIARVERFTAGLEFQTVAANEQTTFAVLHALLIISEAERRLGDEADALMPDQPWHAIRALGNVLRHEYGGVNIEAMWQIVANDLPH
jgi:uncharacterized protein with HEPN domain